MAHRLYGIISLPGIPWYIFSISIEIWRLLVFSYAFTPLLVVGHFSIVSSAKESSNMVSKISCYSVEPSHAKKMNEREKKRKKGMVMAIPLTYMIVKTKTCWK